MKTITPHVLFTQPISRRTYTWLLFLSPFAAVWIYLSARSPCTELTKKSN